MNDYIKKSEAVDVIVKYPYDIAGKTATAIKMIEDLPSADVVPRSEVDYWKQQTFNACMNNGYLDPKIITHLLENADGHDDPTGEKGTDGLEAAISYAKSDTARKILMDIKALMQIIILDYKNIGSFDNAEIVGYVRDHLLSELEKRYTGGEG